VVANFATSVKRFEFSNQDRNLIAGQLGVVPEAITDVYPSTPLQESMVSQFLESKDAYMLMEGFKVARSFSYNDIKAGWMLLISRHDILRTVFTVYQHRMYQVRFHLFRLYTNRIMPT
jgi:hypothetical protein